MLCIAPPHSDHESDLSELDRAELMRFVPNVLLIALTALLSSCSLFGLDGDEPTVAEVTTSQQVYQLSDTTNIDLIVENVSSSTIYFDTCDRQGVEKVIGDVVIETSTFERLCRCFCQVRVKPGEQKNMRVGIHWFDEPQTGEVTYRLWPFLYKKEEFKARVSREAIQVSRFTFAEQ